MIISNTLRRFLRSVMKDTRGANMVEYLVVVGLVALGAILAFQGFSSSSSDAIKKQGDKVKTLGGS